MQNLVLTLSVVVGFQMVSERALAEFTQVPPGPVEIVAPNESQCGEGTMITALDSRLKVGQKAKYKISNGGVYSSYKEVVWNLEVLNLDSQNFLQQWKVDSFKGVTPTEQELNTDYSLKCDETSCFSQLGDLIDISSYSPCRLAGGFNFGHEEEDGYYTFKKTGETIRAKKVVTGFEGEMICPQIDSQYGQRINTKILTPDIPNYIRHSSCAPNLIVEKYEFVNEKGDIIHTVHNELLSGDLSK